MSLDNFLLCAIAGVHLEGEHALSTLFEDPDVPPQLLAMALARTGRVDDLCRLLRTRSDMPVGLLAACGLFLGLTVDPGQARRLFKVLREIRPLDPDVWLAIARFDAAIGDEAAALRAAAIHAELTGISFSTPAREDAAPAGVPSGAIRILQGDVNIEL